MAIKKHDLDNWTPADPTNPLKSLAIEVNANFDSVQADINKLSANAGVSGKGFASGYVNAGTFVTLDNIKCAVTTGGCRGLSLATTTGSIQAHISATFGYVNGVGGNATTQSYTYNTTPSGSLFGYSFPNQGDGSVYLINDVTNWRFYRVTLMIGPGYNNNFISIERLY
jgi:hypothetical protein